MTGPAQPFVPTLPAASTGGPSTASVQLRIGVREVQQSEKRAYVRRIAVPVCSTYASRVDAIAASNSLSLDSKCL